MNKEKTTTTDKSKKANEDMSNEALIGFVLFGFAAYGIYRLIKDNSPEEKVSLKDLENSEIIRRILREDLI